MVLRRAAVAGVSLALGLLLFVAVRGPVRGFAGDILVVVFLVAALATVRLGSPTWRLVGVGTLAMGLELLQSLHLVGPGSPWLAHLLLGSTFDPWDVVAYGLGLGVAWALERWW
jgi:hypothetical protein